MQLPSLFSVSLLAQISKNNGHSLVVYKKKLNDSKTVLEKDNHGWLREPNTLEVFRSVVNGEWVTKEQFDQERRLAKKVGAVYKSRKGFRVVDNTYQGIAWYQKTFQRRIAVFWNGESWIRLKRLVY